MYSWYATKYYYKRNDPLCDACNKAIDTLTTDALGQHVGGFTRMALEDDPPIDKGCEFTRVPAFVYHGSLIYEAKGDETYEDFVSIVRNILDFTDPSIQGIR